ncbi:hypothetical protein A2311_02950 [candidate division WOR-1 bacterium RIFOXYB2_FULL_48_7]|uniref:Outer membrane protein beta-barrel domain-containing protein n=1 Tax=candidate division WOR-1 bacterium RIFOXYB2_FULL_48_7 TaxID=1802583 RepID=A0A1F4TW20_UNCSA|nr:MAG: hypothetical protein A2311_02950 [candidate division WOR-1 bacterium RIFOXYB2_FULL_48_7]
MKKITFVLIIILILFSSMVVAAKRNHRIGVGLAVLSPTSDILVTRNSTIGLNIDYDTKVNENLDIGVTLGYLSYRPKTATYDAGYGILKCGLTGRIYLASWNVGKTDHGLANFYLDIEGNAFSANKQEEFLSGSPASFSGLGVAGGLGMEMMYGPAATLYAAALYQRTAIKSTDNIELPLDGYVIQVGTRVALTPKD